MEFNTKILLSTAACLTLVGQAASQHFATLNAISDTGVVAGSSTSSRYTFTGFVFRLGRVTQFGTFGGPASVAFGVNNFGVAVGQSDTGLLEINGQEYVSVGYYADWSGVHALPALPGYIDSAAYGINNHGDVVGFAYNESPTGAFTIASHAFLFDRNGMHDLGTLGEAGSSAFGINDRGQIVGGSMIANSRKQHAFVYVNGHMTDLGTLGGSVSQARSINNRGEIVGFSFVPSGDIHAMYSYKGAMRDLGTLGGNFSRAWAISGEGVAVGESTNSSDQLHAVVWQDGSVIDLGLLPGGTFSEAFGINNEGVVVGTADVANGDEHAVAWVNGTVFDLGVLP